MTAAIVCSGESCDSVFESRKELFKMKKNGLEGLFCFGCVSQITKDDGWEMKSRDSLARYKEITGEDFVPYQDPFLEDEPPTDDKSEVEYLKLLSSRENAKSLVEILGGLIKEKGWQFSNDNELNTKKLIKMLESLSKSKNIDGP